jgi:anti-anti-sigma factor
MRPNPFFDPFPADAPLLGLAVDAEHPARISVFGEVDGSNSDHLQHVIDEVSRQQDSGTIEVDLGGVTFLDSAGIRALVSCQTTAHETGSQLVLSNMRPIVRRVLEITGVLEVFGVPAQSA